MRTFHCDHCRNPVFFENTRCTNCGHELGVLPDYLRVTALQAVGNGLWRSLMPAAQDKRYRRCENGVQHEVCNWMVVAEEGEAFCVSCRLNAVIPNLSRPGFLDHWFRLERSKRRLLYSLIKLGLPLQSRQHNPDRGLAFSFLSAQDAAPGEPILTGHANGHITLNIDEADPARRERNRLDLNEKYRTLLGHFRHEIGHYYWDLLIRDSEFIDGFRALFGDERQDYGGALNQYYANGAPAHWQDRYISRYASAHPWEDWAESWAHYLHIVDTLETAGHFGLRVERKRADGRVDRADPSFDAYRINSFERIIDHWLPLTYALNSLNRSMG
ncbi:MAG: putative zinc-binding peptidase, partial [Chromatiales bacterium]|nr:putative zinc-binding peptidase [Chromatiales bacterium]